MAGVMRVFTQGWRLARWAVRVVLDGVLPPRCLGCGASVGDDGGLCAVCWREVTFIAPPLCQACGAPFEIMTPGMAICAACHAHPVKFDRARAAFVYDEHSKAILLRFKHGDRLDAAPAFGRLLARAGADLLAHADIITAVPLHRWRLFQRRYNQAAVLAYAAARVAGRRGCVVPDLLVRRRPTPIQGRLSRLGRRRNVAGAFTLRRRWASRLAGKRILIIDDVLTTGATLEECARVLKRAGTAQVDVLTLARVPMLRN